MQPGQLLTPPATRPQAGESSHVSLSFQVLIP
jgi:hypothetical protein